jgi:hypothetical protein
MTAIIQQQADVNSSRPSTSSGRGAKSNTSNSISEMFAHLSNPVDVIPQTRSPIRRAQPVGGPFFASGTGGGDQSNYKPGKAQLSHHTASNVFFG